MGIEFIISFLFFTITCFYICMPLLSKSDYAVLTELHTIENKTEDLQLKKEEILLSLKDIEMDYQMKKISKEDYDSIYDETFQQGTEVLKQIEELKQNPKAAVAKRSSGKKEKTETQIKKQAKYCMNCGEPLAKEAKFCSQCGSKI